MTTKDYSQFTKKELARMVKVEQNKLHKLNGKENLTYEWTDREIEDYARSYKKDRLISDLEIILQDQETTKKKLEKDAFKETEKGQKLQERKEELKVEFKTLLKETGEWITIKVRQILNSQEWGAKLYRNTLKIGMIDEGGKFISGLDFEIRHGRDFGDDLIWEANKGAMGSFPITKSDEQVRFYVGFGTLLSSSFIQEELKEKLNGEFASKMEEIRDEVNEIDNLVN